MTGTSLRSRALAAGVASHGRPLTGGAGGGLCGAAVSCGRHLRNHPQKMAPGKAGVGMGCLGPEVGLPVLLLRGCLQLGPPS